MHLHEAGFEDVLERLKELTGGRVVLAADVVTPGKDRIKKFYVAEDTTAAVGLVHQLVTEVTDCDRLRRLGMRT